MPRTRPVSVGSTTTEVGLRLDLLNRRVGVLSKRCWIAAIVAFAGVTVGCDSSADPATTTIEVSPPTTPVESTVPMTPTTKAAPTTAAPTTVAVTIPDTTQPSPATTTVEDELLIAIDRAQTAILNCYATLPEPCDQSELENALVGPQLDQMNSTIQESMTSGDRANPLDLVWTLIEGPTLKTEELAEATVCRYDASVAVDKEGNIVNDDVVSYLQTWHLWPVGQTWKLSETINQKRTVDPKDEQCG